MGGLSKTDSKVVGSKKRNQYGFFFCANIQIFPEKAIIKGGLS
jgi:hypothetical protein